MFKLHDKTRRLLTLLIFLLLGPTLLVVVVTKTCSRHSIRTVAEWETLLGNSLGKRVEVESLSFPAPGVVRFSQCQVVDQETNEILLQIPEWELIEMIGEMPQHVSRQTERIGETQVGTTNSAAKSTEFYESYIPRTPYRRGMFASIGFAFSRSFGRGERYWHCEIPTVSCYESTVPHIKDMLADLMTKRPGTGSRAASPAIGTQPVTVYVGEIDIFSQSEKVVRANTNQGYDCLSFKNLDLEFRPTDDKTTLCAVWHSGDAPSDAMPMQLFVSRLKDATSAMNIRFHTGSTKMPARFLARSESFFGSFGDTSHFKGTLLVDQQRVGLTNKRTRSLELKQAELSNIALDAFLQNALSFRLDGSADRMTFDSIVFRNDAVGETPFVLEYAKGILFNGRGIVNWPGMRQLVKGMRLQTVPEMASPPESDVSFRNATFAFIFDAQGVRLFPEEIGPSQSRPLLQIDNLCEIYRSNPGHTIRYDELLAALSRPDASQIPLTPETRHLISTLPVATEAVPRQPIQQQFEPLPIVTQQQGSQPPVQQHIESPQVQPTLNEVLPTYQNNNTMTAGNNQYPDNPAYGDTSYTAAVMPTYTHNVMQQHSMPPQPQPHTPQSPPSQPPLSAASDSYHYTPPSESTIDRRYQFLDSPQQMQPAQQSQPQGMQPAMTPQRGYIVSQQNNGSQPLVQPPGMMYGTEQPTVNQPGQQYNAHYASQQASPIQRRVIIPSMTVSGNRIQTVDTPGELPGNTFPGTNTPSFFNPFETQIASAPHETQQNHGNGYALPEQEN